MKFLLLSILILVELVFASFPYEKFPSRKLLQLNFGDRDLHLVNRNSISDLGLITSDEIRQFEDPHLQKLNREKRQKIELQNVPRSVPVVSMPLTRTDTRRIEVPKTESVFPVFTQQGHKEALPEVARFTPSGRPKTGVRIYTTTTSLNKVVPVLDSNSVHSMERFSPQETTKYYRREPYIVPVTVTIVNETNRISRYRVQRSLSSNDIAAYEQQTLTTKFPRENFISTAPFYVKTPRVKFTRGMSKVIDIAEPELVKTPSVTFNPTETSVRAKYIDIIGVHSDRTPATSFDLKAVDKFSGLSVIDFKELPIQVTPAVVFHLDKSLNANLRGRVDVVKTTYESTPSSSFNFIESTEQQTVADEFFYNIEVPSSIFDFGTTARTSRKYVDISGEVDVVTPLTTFEVFSKLSRDYRTPRRLDIVTTLDNKTPPISFDPDRQTTSLPAIEVRGSITVTHPANDLRPTTVIHVHS